MKIEIKKQTVNFKPEPQEKTSLVFSNTFEKYMLAISRFRLKFKSDHHVRRIGVNLAANAVINEALSYTAGLTLFDTSDNFLDEGAIDVCAVACVGVDDPELMLLANQTPGEANPRYKSRKISVPGINSFELTYENNKDHHVKVISADTYLKDTSTDGKISMSAEMWDASNNHAIADNMSHCYLGYEGSSKKLWTKPFKLKNDETMEVEHKKKQCGIMISGFYVSYSDGKDHHLKEIEVGAKLEASGNNCRVVGCLTLDDSSSHYKKDSSYVKGFVFGYDDSL